MKSNTKSNIKQNLLLAASALALIGAVATSTGCGKTVQAEETTRTIDGILTEAYYPAEDRIGMNIVTFDGHHWKIDDYTAPFYTECTVTFNTNGTAEVEDDIIISVDTHTEF